MVGPRRRNHEGNVRHRPDGRYEARLALGGVRKSYYGATEDEVLAKVRKAASDHERGVRQIVGPAITVGEWLEEWLADYIAPTKAVRTTESYSDIVHRYLIPSLGDLRLAKLSAEPHRIDRMLAAIARETKPAKLGADGKPAPLELKLSATSVRYVFVVLRIALRRAVKAGKLVVDPTSYVDAPRKVKFEVTPLTSEEAAALLVAMSPSPEFPTGHRYEAMIRTFLSAGLRRSELLGLTWPAVDLKHATIDVRSQLLRADLVPPKRDSLRKIEIPAETVAALETHKATQVRPLPGATDWDDRDFVFAGDHGHPLNPRGVARAFDTVLRRTGLPHQRLHDLRHAFATILLAEGEDIVVISKLLGHTSLGTTADTYTHLTPAMRTRAASRMGTALQRRAK